MQVHIAEEIAAAQACILGDKGRREEREIQRAYGEMVKARWAPCVCSVGGRGEREGLKN